MRQHFLDSSAWVLMLCAAALPFSAVAQEQSMQIHYGVVQALRPVTVADHSKSAALVGGLVGVLAFQGFTGSATADAITGGAIGGGGTVALEKWGQRRIGGMQYDVLLHSGETIQIITDQTGVESGDCVAVEADEKHANLRRVSEVHCDTAADNWQDPHVQANARQAAHDCQQAKRALLAANNDDQVEAAARRARALCDT